MSLPTIVVATSLLLIGIVTGSYLSNGSAGPSEQIPSPGGHGIMIAVLPFINISGDEEKDYFSDGLSEDISTALSRFSEWQVIPSRLTYSYQNSTDLAAVGREHGAAFVIAGSVRLGSGRVRINAQVIDVLAGTQLWAESYDQELTTANLFEVQADVARRVVGTIADASGVLIRAGQERLRSQPTDELEAYDCVLRSYAYLRIHDDETHLVARDCLERAVKLDPAYVDAWAHLAYMFSEEYRHNRNRRPNALERAFATAQHAIDLNDANPMARYSMSMTQFQLGDVPTAIAHAERAISLNPNDVTFLAVFGIYLTYAGDIDRGLALTNQAQALNPLSPDWLYTAFASAHYQKGEYEECLEILPNWTQAIDVQWHFHKTAALAQLGRSEEAKEALEQMLEADPGFARDPLGELRKYALSAATVEMYLEGLIKAGLVLPDESTSR